MEKKTEDIFKHYIACPCFWFTEVYNTYLCIRNKFIDTIYTYLSLPFFHLDERNPKNNDVSRRVAAHVLASLHHAKNKVPVCRRALVYCYKINGRRNVNHLPGALMIAASANLQGYSTLAEVSP